LFELAFDYDIGVTGIPQPRETGWFITDRDTDPVRHLFLCMEERMDGSGVWTVELHECRDRRGDAGKAMHSYPSETAAREALDLIYRLSRYLVPLPTWNEQQVEDGRWRVRVYEPAGSVRAFRSDLQGNVRRPDA
jgi:hypothetical protein